jgi:hypothetical protein
MILGKIVDIIPLLLNLIFFFSLLIKMAITKPEFCGTKLKSFSKNNSIDIYSTIRNKELRSLVCANLCLFSYIKNIDHATLVWRKKFQTNKYQQFIVDGFRTKIIYNCELSSQGHMQDFTDTEAILVASQNHKEVIYIDEVNDEATPKIIKNLNAQHWIIACEENNEEYEEVQIIYPIHSIKYFFIMYSSEHKGKTIKINDTFDFVNFENTMNDIYKYPACFTVSKNFSRGPTSEVWIIYNFLKARNIKITQTEIKNVIEKINIAT